jgi:hypothetical protein
MRRSFTQLLIGAFVAAVPLFASTAAYAAATCTTPDGTIVIDDPTSCEFVVSGGCSAQCTPVNFTLSCSGQCDVDASVDCTGSCQTDCESSCTPGSIDCEGDCETDCSGNCESECSSDSGDTDCVTNCQGTCHTDCQESCTVNPPDCQTACQSECQGSCKGQAQVDCNVGCVSNLTGGCTANCSAPSGAFFCDGQFVDVTDISQCSFTLDLNVSGAASASCAASPTLGGGPLDLSAIGVAVAGVGIVAARRRKSSKK